MAGMSMQRRPGFTVIEIIVVVVFLAVASTVFFVQKRNLEVGARDAQRKTAINAMHYALEKVYYAKHKSYPAQLSPEVLPAVDPALFNDPAGTPLGQTHDEDGIPLQSDYRYEPTGCDGNTCRGYSLRAQLENEADYQKTHQNGR